MCTVFGTGRYIKCTATVNHCYSRELSHKYSQIIINIINISYTIAKYSAENFCGTLENNESLVQQIFPHLWWELVKCGIRNNGITE